MRIAIRANSNRLRILSATWFLLFLWACGAPETRTPPVRAVDRANVFFYLDPPVQGSVAPRGEARVTALGDGTTSHPLALPGVKFAGGAQRFLGAAWVPPGQYLWIRIDVRSDDMGWQEHRVLLERPLELDVEQASCLFVSPHPTEEGQREEKWSARPQASRHVGERILALSRQLDSVFVVEADHDRVVAAYSYPGRLTALRADAPRDRFYLLDADGRRLLVVAATDGRVLDRIPLPLVGSPDLLAVDEKGEVGWVADSLTRLVLRLDLQAGLVTDQKQLPHRPQGLEYCVGSTPGRVAVSLPGAQQVWLLEDQHLTPVGRLDSGLSMGGIDCDADRLVVSDPGGNALWAYSIDGGQETRRNETGLRPDTPWILDDGRVLITLHGNDGLALLPASGGEVRHVFLPGPVLAVAEARRSAYVSLGNPSRLAVLDLASETLRHMVELGVPASQMAQIE